MKILATILSILFIGSLQAQLPCGTAEPENPTNYDRKVLQKEIVRLSQSSKQDPRIFMMNVNIIRSNTGTQGISVNEVNAAMIELNEAYQFANIRFEVCDDINYIDDSSLLTTSSFEVAGLMSKYNLDNVINVYFIPDVLNSSGESICGSASFPSTTQSERRVLMDNDCVGNGSTFIHELGHFFNLRHTHSTAGGEERVARIGCEITGDGFCDTPADPRLSSSNVSSCNYIGGDTDAFGDVYEPDESNFMSYAPKICRITFSAEQEAAISLAAQGVNDYLRSSCGISDYTLDKIGDEDISVELFKELKFDFVVKNTKFIENEKVKLNVALASTNAGLDKLVWEDEIEFESADQEINLEITLPFTEDLVSYRYMNIWVDKDDEIDEFNESNNRLSYEMKSKSIGEDQIKFFPNPVEDEASLFISNQLTGDYLIEILDINGRLIRSTIIDKESTFLLQTLDFSALNPNVYIMRISLRKEKIETIKFVKK